jgi:hypothetical protein
MNTTRHQAHFLSRDLLMHPKGHALDSERSPRRLWWLVIGLALLTVFLIGVVR